MYICKRCNYETTLKANLVSHLKTQKECKAINQDIDRNILIQEIERLGRRKPEREKCICTTCKKVFFSKSSFCHHIQTCAPSPIEQSERIFKLEQEILMMKERQNYIEEQLKKILNIQAHDSTVINGDHNFVQNIHLNLTLRNFGEENMHAISEHDVGDCFLNLQFKDLIEQLHCNEDYPENHNVRIKSVKRKIMEIYQFNKWNTTSFKEGFPKLILQIHKIFYDYVQKNKETIKDEMTKEEFANNIETLKKIGMLDKNAIKNIVKEIEVLLESNREMLDAASISP